MCLELSFISVYNGRKEHLKIDKKINYVYRVNRDNLPVHKDDNKNESILNWKKIP